MTGGKRKEEQVVPEVEAAWAKLMKEYLHLRDPIDDRSIRGIKDGLNQFGRWLRILEAEDVIAAFRKQVLEDMDFLGGYIEMPIDYGQIGAAIKNIRVAEARLIEYAQLLGQEVPPEEEEAPTEGPVEEPSVEEERPWEELEITREMHERPLLEILMVGVQTKPEKSNASLINNKISRALNMPNNKVFVGPTLQLLDEGGWDHRQIPGIGEGLMRLLQEKLSVTGYPVPLKG